METRFLLKQIDVLLLQFVDLISPRVTHARLRGHPRLLLQRKAAGHGRMARHPLVHLNSASGISWRPHFCFPSSVWHGKFIALE